LELALDKATKENRELKIERTELRRQAKAGKSKSNSDAGPSAGKSEGSKTLTSQDKRIGTLGKMFYTMSQCFVAPEVFKFSQRVTKMSVTNPERFKNRETNICVIQREVIEATPDDLVEMAKTSPHFGQVVRTPFPCL
jgi:hypothetical protein